MDSSYIKSNWKSWLFGLVFLATVAIAIAGLVIAVQAKSQPQQSGIYNIKNRNGKSPGGGTKPKLGGVLAAVGDTPASELPYAPDGKGGVTFTVPVTFSSIVTNSLTTKVQNTTGNLACTTLVVGTGASIGNGIAASASPGLQVGNASNPNATFSVFGDSTFDGTSSFSGVANFAEGATFGKDSAGNPASFDSSGKLKVYEITAPSNDYNFISINQNLRIDGNSVVNAGRYTGLALDGSGNSAYNALWTVFRPPSTQTTDYSDSYTIQLRTDESTPCSAGSVAAYFGFWGVANGAEKYSAGSPIIANPYGKGFGYDTVANCDATAAALSPK